MVSFCFQSLCFNCDGGGFFFFGSLWIFLWFCAFIWTFNEYHKICWIVTLLYMESVIKPITNSIIIPMLEFFRHLLSYSVVHAIFDALCNDHTGNDLHEWIALSGIPNSLVSIPSKWIEYSKIPYEDEINKKRKSIVVWFVPVFGPKIWGKKEGGRNKI